MQLWPCRLVPCAHCAQSVELILGVPSSGIILDFIGKRAVSDFPHCDLDGILSMIRRLSQQPDPHFCSNSKTLQVVSSTLSFVACPLQGASPAEFSDEELLLRFAAGDRDAAEELFSRYRPLAYGVAHRILGNHADAQDAVQEGFCRAFTHLRGFQGRSSFKTWLLAIVTCAALDLRRKARRQTALRGRAAVTKYDARVRGEQADTVLQQLLLKEIQGEMVTILACAEDRMQKIVRRSWAGWTHQQIASEIGLSAETIRKTLARWRRFLVRELKSRGMLP